MRSLRSTLVLWMLAAACENAEEPKQGPSAGGPATDAGEPPASKAGRAPWRPLDPSESFADKSLAEWAVEWMRWSFSQTSCDSSNFDPDGSLCRLYQDDPELPVFFMAYAPSKHPRTRCTVPRGRALLVPLANFFSDDGGSTKMRTIDQLEDVARQALESVTGLHLRVDGDDVEELERFVVPPTQYSYHVPAAPNWYSCNGYKGVEETVIEPAVVSGYFALLPAPALGAHELEYGGVITHQGEDVSLQMINQFDVVNE